MSCWNVGTTGSWKPWKESPWVRTTSHWQVKRLVLSGVIPTIQQQREREIFCAFHTLSIRKSDNVKKLNHISCLVGMLERLAPGALERKSLGQND
jgi:hypothetical protein